MEARGGDVVSDLVSVPRPCEGVTKSGNRCIGRAVPGTSLCPLHTSPAAASEHMRQLSAKGHAARYDAEKEELAALMAACDFSTLESIETWLSSMAKFAVEKGDPRFLAGAARVVETGRWYHEAKAWRAECLECRRRNKVKQSAIKSDC